MRNPKYRGDRFTWAAFPNMVSDLATANLPMSYKSNKADEAKLDGYVRALAEERVKREAPQG